VKHPLKIIKLGAHYDTLNTGTLNTGVDVYMPNSQQTLEGTQSTTHHSLHKFSNIRVATPLSNSTSFIKTSIGQ